MNNLDKLFNANKYNECILLLNQYLQAEPDSPVWLAYKGLCYLNLERYQEAIKLFNYSLEIDDFNASALIFRGRCYFSLQQYDKAAKDFRQALLMDPDNYAVIERLACALSRTSEMESAINLMQLSIAKNPNPMAYRILINLYLEAGLVKEAEALNKKGMLECPNFANTIKS